MTEKLKKKGNKKMISEIKSEHFDYSSEEKQLLADARVKMAKWIYENVVPFINNKIEIGWGGMFSNNGDSVYRWRAIITKNGFFMGCDFGSDKVLPSGKFEEHPLFPCNMTEQCLKNWNKIKSECLERVEKDKEYLSLLKNFTV